MTTDADPIAGNWYRNLDKGQEFFVVAVDKAGGTIEIQHFDGDIEEIDLDAWPDLNFEPVEAPEDWTGPLDDIERDDLGYDVTEMSPDDWREPLDELRNK